MNLLGSVRYFIPELILIAEALVILIAVMFKGKRMAAFLALMGLAVSFLVLMSIKRTGMEATLFNGIIVLDNFAIFFKGLCIVVTFITILFSVKSKYKDLLAPEYYVILLLSTVGMCVMASARDMLMAYIALETVSISSYILTAFLKGDKKSSEAGLKYIIYGAIASGIMIYGMSLLYGLAGTTSFTGIAQVLSTESASPILLVITFMILAGFGYKIAAVPFHMWCPDVYEGAPTPVTAFLSVAPKAAGFAILIRFLIKALPGLAVYNVTTIWQPVLLILCILTMTIGNLSALKQTNLKRLLAYSSIAHCGYMLMGVVLFTGLGLEALIMYFVIYLFMNLGAFLVVIYVKDSIGSEDIKDYKGLGWKMPLVGVVMAIFMFSLTGLPPLAGFIGKLYIFKAVIYKATTATSWCYLGINVWYWLAVIGALNSVIALYYYARVIKAMFLEDADSSTPNPKETSVYYSTLLVIFVIPVIILGVYWVPLLNVVKATLG